MVGHGKKVFLDLKLFDVPATVAGAVRNLRNRGVTFATVHGNQAIMEAAVAAADSVGILAVQAAGLLGNPILLLLLKAVRDSPGEADASFHGALDEAIRVLEQVVSEKSP